MIVETTRDIGYRLTDNDKKQIERMYQFGRIRYTFDKEVIARMDRLSVLADTGGEIKERKLSNTRERQKGKIFGKIEAKEFRSVVDHR